MTTTLLIIAAISGALCIHPITRDFLKFIVWRVSFRGHRTAGRVSRHGAMIHYREFGVGETLVLLHGGLSSSLDWFRQIPFLAGLGRRLILIDTRGHGVSSLGTAEFTYSNLAADVVAVLDQLGIARTAIIGWSDGGNTALRLAGLHPERVASMILISANYSPDGLRDPTLSNFSHQGLTRLKRWLVGSDDRRLVAEIKHLWQNYPRISPGELNAIATPTLVIIGEHDEITLAHAEEMVSLLPGASLHVLEGAGHHALLTHAKAVNELARGFFSQ